MATTDIDKECVNLLYDYNCKFFFKNVGMLPAIIKASEKGQRDLKKKKKILFFCRNQRIKYNHARQPQRVEINSITALQPQNPPHARKRDLKFLF